MLLNRVYKENFTIGIFAGMQPLFCMPAFLILLKSRKENQKMNTNSPSLLEGTWNARNLFTVIELAEWARFQPKTVYRWIRQGKHEAIQFGPRTFRVPEDAIAPFLRHAGLDTLPEKSTNRGRQQK